MHKGVARLIQVLDAPTTVAGRHLIDMIVFHLTNDTATRPLKSFEAWFASEVEAVKGSEAGRVVSEHCKDLDITPSNFILMMRAFVKEAAPMAQFLEGQKK
jgi:hypothetical protein